MIISGTVDELDSGGYFDNMMLRGYFRDDKDEDEPIGGYDDDECEDDEYCDDDE